MALSSLWYLKHSFLNHVIFILLKLGCSKVETTALNDITIDMTFPLTEFYKIPSKQSGKAFKKFFTERLNIALLK